jgi:hypothetical protein
MSELARQEQTTLKRMAVPAALQALGVVMAVDPADGREVVIIPPEVRQQVNVLDPVSSFAQARPDWSPAVRIVQLDPDAKDGPHFYEQQGKKLALRKQGLELLAKAANVLYTRARRMPKGELVEGETMGYIATIGIRRPDGSVEELERSKTFVAEAELEEIKESVTKAELWENNQRTGKPKFGPAGSPAWEAEVRKRWLAELKNAPAKTESKAILRAIRAALQIPHTFTPAQAQRPFVVVGFNFTPDQSDPEIRRMLTAAGLNAQQTFYGPTHSTEQALALEQGHTDTPAPPPADVPVEPEPPPPAEPEAAQPTGPGTDGGDQQAAGCGTDPSPAAAPAPGHDDDDPEPSLGDAQFLAPADAEQLARDAAAAGEAVVPNGDNKGLTVRQVAEKGAKGEEWLGWVLRKWARDTFRAAVEMYVRVYLPDAWAKYEAWLADQQAAQS